MKTKKWIITLVLFVIIVSACAINSFLLSVSSGDIDGDNKNELVMILKRSGDEYGKSLVIVSLQKDRGNRIQIYNMKNLNPWRVHIADVDGDGIKELSIGVYKEARLDPVMAGSSGSV
jgi:hypothetical protein